MTVAEAYWLGLCHGARLAGIEIANELGDLPDEQKRERPRLYVVR